MNLEESLEFVENIILYRKKFHCFMRTVFLESFLCVCVVAIVCLFLISTKMIHLSLQYNNLFLQKNIALYLFKFLRKFSLCQILSQVLSIDRKILLKDVFHFCKQMKGVFIQGHVQSCCLFCFSSFLKRETFSALLKRPKKQNKEIK